MVGWCRALRGTLTRLLDGVRVEQSPSCHGDVPWPQRPEEVEFAMRPYEVMVIFDPDTDERSVQPTLEQLGTQAPVTPPSSALVPLAPARLLDTRTVAFATTVDGAFLGAGIQHAGSVLELTVAGRGGVPVNADSVVLNVTALPDDVKELDRQFTLNESIMRTKVIRTDAH